MDCPTCLGTGARGFDVCPQTGHVRVFDDRDCNTCGGDGINHDLCDCGQAKRDPDDRACPGCMEADAVDEVYERYRDQPELIDPELATWVE